MRITTKPIQAYLLPSVNQTICLVAACELCDKLFPSAILPEIPWTVYDKRIQQADARLRYVVPARCNDPSHAVQVLDGPIQDSLSAIFISNLFTVCLQCDIL